MKSSWREYCKPIIARVLEENKGADEKIIRQALKNAYPFGPREYHPYKIWLDEIQVQRGLKKHKQTHREHDELIQAGQMEFKLDS